MLTRIIFTFLVVFAWLVVFCLGAFINTNPLRQGLQDNFNIGDLVLIVLSWIPTNIAFLSILAGLMGALSRGLLQQVEEEVVQEAPVKKKKNRILGGMVAGFIFYMAFMAGAFIMVDEPFASTTEAQYYRIAGFISFIAFIAGFRPAILRLILEKIPGF